MSEYKVIGHKEDDPCPKCERPSFCADCGVCSHCGHCVSTATDKTDGKEEDEFLRERRRLLGL